MGVSQPISEYLGESSEIPRSGSMGASQPISEYIGELLEDSDMSASQPIGGLEIRIQIIFSQSDKKDNRSGFCLVDFASGLSAIYEIFFFFWRKDVLLI